MRTAPTLFLLAMTALVGCAGAEPMPVVAPVRDTAAYMPADAIEMTFDGKPEQTKPTAQPRARAADKPSVATREQRRGLFSLAKKN